MRLDSVDSKLTMSTHINKTCGAGFFKLYNICLIIKFVSKENTETLSLFTCSLPAGLITATFYSVLPTFRGQRLWNSLPDEFQSITNLDVFKVKIKQHFLRVFLEN